MSECIKCRAREINGTLRTYDGYVTTLEEKLRLAVEALEYVEKVGGRVFNVEQTAAVALSKIKGGSDER